MPELHGRSWTVADAKAAVVVVHGLAEHSGRYEHVAAALNSAGYAVYAWDIRGHGNSPGFPGHIEGGAQAPIDDLVAQCTEVARSHGKVFVLAHSMGTLIALPAVAAMPSGTVDGLILSAIATMSTQALLESLLGGKGIPAEWLSRDTEVVKAYVEDPLVFHEAIPDELLGLSAEAVQKALDAIPLITVPVLLLHGLEDKVCDMAGAQQAHAQLIVRDKTLKVYDGLYHEILNEPEKEQVIGDIVSWLEERVKEPAA